MLVEETRTPIPRQRAGTTPALLPAARPGPAPAVPAWCGQCELPTRDFWLGDVMGVLPCPHCHPDTQ